MRVFLRRPNPVTTPVFVAPALDPEARAIAEEVEKIRKLRNQGLFAPVSAIPDESIEELARRRNLAAPRRIPVR